MKRQHTFPQRVGKLIEEDVIRTMNLRPNKRQSKYGFYDAYDNTNVFEIKAAKDNNPFRIQAKNHKALIDAEGAYILVRYELMSADEGLKVITDINLITCTNISAETLLTKASKVSTDVRGGREYYKIHL